ncbi:MAG: hypothetical protein GEU93_13780 [Propionibacteriales bacterium]|nr:hypothetical protein [Propionibacteriales bacterium]
MTHRVFLIRPWDMSDGVGAGCCGGGSTKGLCVDPSHHPEEHGTRFVERTTWEPLAQVYLALRDNLPDDVDVEIVDPRNHLFLVPAMIHDVRRRGGAWRDALVAALHGPAYAAVIVDGRTISSGEVLEPAEAVRAVRDALGFSDQEVGTLG